MKLCTHAAMPVSGVLKLRKKYIYFFSQRVRARERKTKRKKNINSFVVNYSQYEKHLIFFSSFSCAHTEKSILKLFLSLSKDLPAELKHFIKQR